MLNNLFLMRAANNLRWLLILLVGAGLLSMPSRPASAAPAAPVVTTPADGSLTNNPQPTVSGTSDALVTITVVIDGGTAGTTMSDAGGSWTFTPSAPLADGAHAVYAFATDLVPENSPNSNTNNFTVDATAPETTITTAPLTVTNNPSANFEFSGDGTGSAVSGFACSLDGALFSACTSPHPVGPLADGPHTFAVQATDAAGNTDSTPATHGWTIDTTAPAAPVVTAPANGALVNTAQPAISGTGEPNSTITVIIDSASAGTTTANGAGSWSFTPAAPLAQGAHTAAARATDAAGNTGPDSTANNFTIDSVVPAAPVVTTPANGALVNTTQPLISGTGEPNSTITVIIDSGTAGTTTANGTGNWSFTPAALAQGAHTVRARATDAAGNISANSSTNNFTVDTVAPTANIVDVAPDPRTTPVANITITFSEGVVGFGLEDLAFTRNGAQVLLTGASLSGGPASYTLSGLSSLTTPDGSYVLTVLAAGVQDAIGYPLTANAADQWVVDATPPDTLITSSPPAATNTGSASFAFAGNDGTGTGVASFQCSLDGGSFSSCTSPANFSGLDDGAHSFAVRAIDGAGNVDPSPASFSWTIDSTPLSVTLEQAAGQADPTGLAPIRFTVIFNKPVFSFANADVALSGTAPGALSAVVTGSGTTYTVRVSGMTGNGTIVATIPAGAVTDAAGNGNAASTSVDNSVTFETTTPVVTGIVPADPNPSGATSVRFNITFSQSVLGVDAGDFSLEAVGVTGATITSVSGGGAIYSVSVNTGSGEGSLGLNLVDNDSISGFSTGVALGGNGLGNGDFTGDSYTMDRTLPAAALEPVQQVGQNAPSHSFSVTYSDGLAIDRASLGDGDVRVSGPRGYSQLATLVSTTSPDDGPEIVAVYAIQAPGGEWEGGDNGAYQIELVAGEVRDTAGNSVPAGVLGSFNVTLQGWLYLPLIR